MEGAQKSKQVVLVDDDLDLLKLMTFFLQAKGLETHGFSTGKDALEYLLKEENIAQCALLILDRILPDMDGLEILHLIDQKHAKRCPVVILSVLSSDKDVLSGFTSGAVDYITKPFNLEIFYEKVHRLIASSI